MNGRALQSIVLPPGESDTSLDLSGCPVGVYLLEVRSAKGSAVEKVILSN